VSLVSFFDQTSQIQTHHVSRMSRNFFIRQISPPSRNQLSRPLAAACADQRVPHDHRFSPLTSQ
jgi:hypothetical protein